MDELSKQRLGEVAQPLEAGQPLRYAYQYVRNGTRHLFMFFEPLAGQRFVQVTDHRTKIDWAYAVRDLVDSHYPAAERMTLVMDNLNSHSLGCFTQPLNLPKPSLLLTVWTATRRLNMLPASIGPPLNGRFCRGSALIVVFPTTLPSSVR